METENLGDFWFKGLDDDRTFFLKLEKEGKVLSFNDIINAKDVNLGDIPLR